MGKALIIGCGGVASVAIHKCCQNSEIFECSVTWGFPWSGISVYFWEYFYRRFRSWLLGLCSHR